LIKSRVQILGVDQELKYALTFNENFNINIKDNPNVSALEAPIAPRINFKKR